MSTRNLKPSFKFLVFLYNKKSFYLFYTNYEKSEKQSLHTGRIDSSDNNIINPMNNSIYNAAMI